MPVKEIGDPRLQALFGANDPRDGGVQPAVRLPRKGLPPIAIALIAVVMAILLFLVLNARRTQQAEPRVEPQSADRAESVWTAPPPLYIPPAPDPAYPTTPEAPVEPEKQIARPVPTPAPLAHAIASPGPTAEPLPPLTQRMPAETPLPQQHTGGGSPLIIDTGASEEASAPVSRRPAITPAPTTATRMRASALANPSMTVPQGYLIPAVLETGFDSTKPGYARAVVSRDVRGFDGKNVLIPRGSRLIGESEAATGREQKRAVITWTRLIRPDGMTIGLNSPAVDPAGRAGVAASVNNHFFARLGDALLQSSFAIGQALAGRAATGTVVVVGSNAATAGTQFFSPTTNYVPTLKVAPGKSISVFVAHDLDFTIAGTAR